MTARDRLLHAARHWPHAAFELGDTRLTLPELASRARTYSAVLAAHGVTAGDRVAVMAGTSLASVIVNLGHYQLGAIHVPINGRYRAAEVAHILSDSGAAVLVHDAASAAVAGEAARSMAGARLLDIEQLVAASGHREAEPARVSDDHPALLIYTSGTTGRSKGVTLSYRAVVDNIAALTGAWGFSASDRLVLALPLFHVHGLCIGVHGALLSGLTTQLLARFSPEAVVRAFADWGATVFMGVPTMYAMLLEHLATDPGAGAALARGRLFTAGSAALSPEHLATFEAATGHRILERYGMSETLITLSNPLDGERRAGSVGLPVPGCEIDIIDDDGRSCGAGEAGEIWVRSNGIMTGYWNDPEATRAAFTDDWFRTGDVARRDADGYVSIVGRKSVDIIKSGGFKIAAREIEEALASAPGVAEVAVFGAPDPRWGQIVCAAVVAAAGCDEAALPDAVEAHATAHLADYKKPRRVLVLPALPRNALGKVQKPALTRMVGGPETPGPG